MIEWLVNKELKMIWMQMFVALLEVLSKHLPE
jgi:hypothetical protein